MIDGRQCRAARAWLRLEMQDLARRVGTTRHTIRRFEAEEHQPRQATRAAIRAELERYGIRFIFRPDGRPLGIIDESSASCLSREP